jgi:ArsR family transcriptional regulator, arsenate/arsenite/antimonite-responsive transcriptional repressor / arsenate reductase (thioredoxin)
MVVASTRAPAFLKLLAHDLRWQLLAALAGSDRRVQELVELVERPQNLVSYHLGRLRHAGLVSERRSSYDARDVYYRLELAALHEHYTASASSLHPALPAAQPGHAAGMAAHPDRPRARVIFLCTHNSARSQMAEGILRALGGDFVDVASAGGEPQEVHPLAIKALAEMKIDISSQHAKDMGLFLDQHFDYVITVCDRAREACPVFLNDPVQIHWSFADPAAVEGAAEERFEAFRTTARELVTRISYLLMALQRQ